MATWFKMQIETDNGRQYVIDLKTCEPRVFGSWAELNEYEHSLRERCGHRVNLTITGSVENGSDPVPYEHQSDKGEPV